eukprot:1684531-Alexandrium_andersonii.AAC.1
MSASLVGSEMCIRDRLPPSHPNHTLNASTIMNARARQFDRSAHRQRRVPCLLYTSDAADDM